MIEGRRRYRDAFGLALCVLATTPQVWAAVPVASGIRSQLLSQAGPAVAIGIAWFGYLVIMGRGSMQLIVTFLIGAAIVTSGGFL